MSEKEVQNIRFSSDTCGKQWIKVDGVEILIDMPKLSTKQKVDIINCLSGMIRTITCYM